MQKDSKSLNSAEYRRYARHLTLPEVGVQGQEQLKHAKILVIGAGGLGSPTLLYLAAAGVGTIGIVEYDQVDESNLQRQVLYTTEDVGRSKLVQAKARLSALNPYIEIQSHEVSFSADNALNLVEQYDLVIDGSDNFTCRYLANDAAYFAKKPLVSGSIMGFEGQLSVFNYQDGPCYRCLYASPPPPEFAPNCAEAGVLGVLPGTLGCLQATEALKIILGIGEILSGKLLHFAALYTEFTTLEITKDEQCALCGSQPSVTKVREIAAACATNVSAPNVPEITVDELVNQRPEVQLLDVREPFELEICALENSLHIPLGKLKEQWITIPTTKPLVVFCKMGGRSKKAVTELQKLGLTEARSLKGGILEWIKQKDPSLKPY